VKQGIGYSYCPLTVFALTKLLAEV